VPSAFLYCSVVHRDLRSFPTRRSSDLQLRLVGFQAAGLALKRNGDGVRAGVGADDAAQLEEGHRRMAKGFFAQLGQLVAARQTRSEEHTSELQSRFDLVCRLLLEKKKS